MENPFRRLVVYLFVERPIKDKSIAEMYQDLRKSGQQFALNLTTIQDTPKNREHLEHIVTIERWGYSRLGVALGEPFVNEESTDYQPADDTSWLELKQNFLDARAKNLERVIAIQQANPPAKMRIHHNQWGSLSVKGWIRYLDEHALAEGKRMTGEVGQPETD